MNVLITCTANFGTYISSLLFNFFKFTVLIIGLAYKYKIYYLVTS